jgi:hypothetical protein
MSTNVLILAAGEVPFDQHDGGFPLCLTELDGVSIVERIVNNTADIGLVNYCFAILEKDAERYHLDRALTLLAPGAKVVRIPASTKGSACTALLAASQLPRENDLLIVSANELVDLNFATVLNDFKERGLDGGTMTFRSIHPRYSYVRLNSEGLVIETAQQKPISNHATAGVFWFKRTSQFVEAAKSTIRKNASVAGKFYVAPAFNELILEQAKVGVYELDTRKYHPLKTERQVQQFESGVNL